MAVCSTVTGSAGMEAAWFRVMPVTANRIMPTRLTAAEIQCQECSCFSQKDRAPFSAAFGFFAPLEVGSI